MAESDYLGWKVQKIREPKARDAERLRDSLVTHACSRVEVTTAALLVLAAHCSFPFPHLRRLVAAAMARRVAAPNQAGSQPHSTCRWRSHGHRGRTVTCWLARLPRRLNWPDGAGREVVRVAHDTVLG